MTNWKIALGGAALALAVVSGAASADTYDWTLTGVDTGSGQLTTTGTGPSVEVTGFWGTIDGKPVSGVVGGYTGSQLQLYAGADNTGQGWNWNYDNVLHPSDTESYVDNDGILFSYGGGVANLFGNGLGDYAFAACSPSGLCFDPLNTSGDIFTVAAVPEPSIWAMLLLGLGMTGLALRGAKRETAIA